MEKFKTEELIAEIKTREGSGEDILENIETEDLIAEIGERECLSEMAEGLPAQELMWGREDEFNMEFIAGFGDLTTPSEKETFKRFLCDLLGVSYHTPLLTNLTKLKKRLK